jgi:RNA polymerase sigma factor (sigma-70 family)
MGERLAAVGDQRSAFLAFYDEALPHVYGYLAARCRPPSVVEDLTAETFLAAADAVRRDDPPAVSIPWVIGVARHKLADHWRRRASDERRLQLLSSSVTEVGEPGELVLDNVAVRQVLDELDTQHRAALTPRYLDDLSVPDVAELLGRSVQATEALLVRPRRVPAGMRQRGGPLMTDPFEQLYSPVDALEPEPEFATRLRARLERAFDLPKGVTVSSITSSSSGQSPSLATARGEQAEITPYLAVAGAQAALGYYVEAVGARIAGEPIVMPDGRVGHAELDIAGARRMLSEEHPEIGVVAPSPGGASAVTLHLETTDVDATMQRALVAGAALERPAADHPSGRNGVLRDPFGHRWMISSAPSADQGAGAGAGLRHGDIGYASLRVPELGRAATFYAAVLGWRYRPASGLQGRQVEGLSLHHGLWGGVERPTLFLCFAVEDVGEALQRVRDAGGTAGGPHEEPCGVVAECADDQGTSFAVFTPPGSIAASAASDAAASAGGRAPGNGAARGDLAYVTMEVQDSARAQDFYGTVLGWRIRPGRVADGWQVEQRGADDGHLRRTRRSDDGAHVPRRRPCRRPAGRPRRRRQRWGPGGPALRDHLQLCRRPGDAIPPRPALTPPWRDASLERTAGQRLPSIVVTLPPWRVPTEPSMPSCSTSTA